MFGKRSTVMTRGWRGSMPWRPVFNAGSVPLSPSGPSVSLSSSRLALDFVPLVPAFLSLATSVVRLFSVNSVSFPPLSLSPFPYLLLPFIHRLFPPFCSFLFPSFTFSPSTSFHDSICSTRTSLLPNLGLFANSNEFEVSSYFSLYVCSIFPSGQCRFDWSSLLVKFQRVCFERGFQFYVRIVRILWTGNIRFSFIFSV